MSNRIYVDIGSTFTDCIVIHQQEMLSVKTPTIPYDAGESILSALRECARRLQTDLYELLKDTSEIRYATTTALNQLLARKGPILGLLTTAGAEDSIYIGLGAQWVDGLKDGEWQELLPKAKKPTPLIPRENCVGVRERIDSQGNVIRPLDEEHLRRQIHRLIKQGVQGFVVALLWSFLNPVHELRVREIIHSEFSGNLYAFPVILSSEVIPVRGEYQRTMTAVINAYLQKTMQEELSSMAVHLRNHGYQGPLNLVKNSGGVSEVWRTTPVSTYNGGPVAGLIGCMHLAKLYGNKIIATDMGGASFDIGVMDEVESISHEFRPMIDRWLIRANMLQVSSISAGSGTIFRVNPEQENALEIGTYSAGTVPGPAAYDLGGNEPTVLDADLVLGYLNPETFGGGKRKLNRERAIRVIDERIARPLGITVIEAASQMRRMINELIGHTLMKETVMRGYDPREFTVFSYGGSGPTHCCDYTRALEPKRIITFPFSPVFCALATSFLSQSRTYYVTKPYVLMYPRDKRFTDDYETYNRIVAELQTRALLDLETNERVGYSPVFHLELDMKFGGQVHVKRIVSPRLRLHSPADVEAVYRAFLDSYRRRFSSFSLFPEGGVVIESFILRATMPQDPIVLPVYPEGITSPSRALKGRRDIFWIHEGHWMSTPVYWFELLKPGNIIEGPAVIEDHYTTYCIPFGYRLKFDQYMAGIIERI
jgi:N-methylhydantoinase A/oxoprolinase/acetone carboxylase beta subunit